ncbi:hypothetical protein FRC15_008372 [Serendipita sp. 397]|nr:hypothetical protein FRC15_008372 [Serendipita sp. 397]
MPRWLRQEVEDYAADFDSVVENDAADLCEPAVVSDPLCFLTRGNGIGSCPHCYRAKEGLYWHRESERLSSAYPPRCRPLSNARERERDGENFVNERDPLPEGDENMEQNKLTSTVKFETQLEF